MIKRTKYIFASLLWTAALAIFVCSCENKRDNNGDFGGMWQMTAWNETSTGETQSMPHIYYNVHKNLIKFHDASDPGHYHLSYFRQTADSLVVFNIVDFPYDTLCNASALARYGVPESGKFGIQTLNDKHLVLTCPERTLTFRKY